MPQAERVNNNSMETCEAVRPETEIINLTKIPTKVLTFEYIRANLEIEVVLRLKLGKVPERSISKIGSQTL